MKKVWFLALLFAAANCASSQVEDTEPVTRYEEQLSERERRRRIYEEEARKRLAALESAKQDRERLEAEERERQLREERQRAEAERKREEALRAEEERKKQEAILNNEKQKEQLQAEEAKRAEEQKLEEERQREQRRREEEERARKERAARLDRTDPDRMLFFRREMEAKLGSISCRGPVLTVYRNRKPLQFHGYTLGPAFDPEIDQPFVFSGRDLAQAFKGKTGHFAAFNGRGSSDLMRCDANPGTMRVLDLESDGEGLWMSLEVEGTAEFFRTYRDSVPVSE